jgi:tetratricopeptide (TPR) repeat protein
MPLRISRSTLSFTLDLFMLNCNVFLWNPTREQMKSRASVRNVGEASWGRRLMTMLFVNYNALSVTCLVDLKEIVLSEVFEEKPPRNCLLTLVVLLFTSCLCLSTITMSGLGGHQDEVRQLRTEAAQTLAVEIATQYQLAVEDEAGGDYEFAVIRYEFILTEQPAGYLDVAERLDQVHIVLSYTPTPSFTNTPEATPTTVDTATPTVAPATAVTTPTSTSNTPDIAKFFDNAQIYHEVGAYEDAIEYFDIVITLDPAYQRGEVDRMLFESLREQAQIYFKGTNDGTNGYEGDQLARGVQLANRAIAMYYANTAIGSPEDLEYTVFFAIGFLAAQANLAAENYAEAQSILQELCDYPSGCNWTYRGTSVQSLLDRANTGS